MNNQYGVAECLISEGYNATELAEALQVTRQSALAIIRTIDRNRLSGKISMASGALRSMVPDSPTLQSFTERGSFRARTQQQEMTDG